MDSSKTGELIRRLRLEKGLTQQALAEKLFLSNKTISKWERGQGCPDISLLSSLSELLEVNLKEMLHGELSSNDLVGGNMKHSRFFACPICGNISLCSGQASVSCCGRPLEALVAKKAESTQKLKVENIEDDFYITSDHPMTKEDYISFVAFVTGERVQLIKQYPQWNLSLRLQRRGHGMLHWYSAKEGLLYQLI